MKMYFVVCKNGKNHYTNDDGQPELGTMMPLLLIELDKEYPSCSPHKIITKENGDKK